MSAGIKAICYMRNFRFLTLAHMIFLVWLQLPHQPLITPLSPSLTFNHSFLKGPFPLLPMVLCTCCSTCLKCPSLTLYLANPSCSSGLTQLNCFFLGEALSCLLVCSLFYLYLPIAHSPVYP